MNTEVWIKACPRVKPGDKVTATATSLNGVRQGTEGEVLRYDPDAPGFYIVKWSAKHTTSVPWDSVEKVK